MTEAWKQWEGQIVDGKFPLRRHLGGSEHSAVYLTEAIEGKSQAAIKLVPAEAENTEARLQRWRSATKLSHPHLLKVFQVGACRLGSVNMLYVVMEYAEEDLSQVLPVRPLTPDESRDMLDPVLDTLTYLHSQGFVHSRLKPANIMAVDDRLKISSDGLCPVGGATAGFGKPSVFDSPETNQGGISPAADVWSLGVTLVDVLTQRLPQKNGHGEPLRLETMPAPFLEIVRHCLRRDPQERWTIAEIKAYLQQLSSGESVMPVPERPKPSAKWRFAIPIAIGLVAVLVAGPRLLRHGPETPQAISTPQTETEASQPSQEATPPPAEKTKAKANQATPTPTPVPVRPQPEASNADANTKASDSGSSEVVHQVVPDVPRQARNTISGKVKVKVRIHVDPAGSVIGAEFVSAGPSQYFARLAMEAARGWKFAPVSGEGTGSARMWVLHFEFSRATTRVVPVRAAS